LYTNTLRSALNTILTNLDSMYEFMIANQALPALENTVNSLMHTNQLVIQNVVDAARGQVTTSLFPASDFLYALEIGERDYKLRPLFDSQGIHHYYPLLESVLTSEAIVIHVPFQSPDVFEVHQIEPFPFSVNGTIMTLDLPPSVVLVSKDFSLYATGHLSDLQKCKSEYLHLYHCPASLFAFLPITGGICQVVLTQKIASKALSLCPYAHLTPQPLFHRTFFSHHYFFFTQPFFVSVVCSEGTVYKEVSGHFAVLAACYLRSANLTTFPSKLHQGFSSNFTTKIFPIESLKNINFSHIKYVTNTISEFTFSNISEFENAIQDSLPPYLTPYVHYPSIIAPIVLIIIIVIPLCCVVKKALTLYRELQKKVRRDTSNY